MIRKPQNEDVFWMWGKYGNASSIRAVGLVARSPAGILRQPRSVRAPRRIEIADDHMVEQQVVQPARSELAADQVRVDVENRNFGQRPFEFKAHGAISPLDISRRGALVTTPLGVFYAVRRSVRRS